MASFDNIDPFHRNGVAVFNGYNSAVNRFAQDVFDRAGHPCRGLAGAHNIEMAIFRKVVSTVVNPDHTAPTTKISFNCFGWIYSGNSCSEYSTDILPQLLQSPHGLSPKGKTPRGSRYGSRPFSPTTEEKTLMKRFIKDIGRD